MLGAFGRQSDEEIGVVDDEDEKDKWIPDGHDVVRVHVKTRRCFFMPVGVQWAPPAKILTASKLTAGSFVDTGEGVRVCHNSIARSTALRDLVKAWIGTT